MSEVPTYTATIFIAGDYAQAKAVCQRHVMDVGLCVTIEPVEYLYTGGCEAGVRVGLINYARFPSEPAAIFDKALTLARLLRAELCQHSFSIVATDKTVFETVREPATHSPHPRGSRSLGTPPDDPIPSFPPRHSTGRRPDVTAGRVKHAEDCQSHIVDVRGRPDECTCGAERLAERVVTHVLIAPEDLQQLVREAYLAGCRDVQENYRPLREGEDPEFGEASYDYVASLDFTETTRPAPAGDRS